MKLDVSLGKQLNTGAPPDDSSSVGLGDTEGSSPIESAPAAHSGKDGWDKAHLIAQMLTAVCTMTVAGAATWYGYSFNRWQAEQREAATREDRLLQQRQVEIQRVGAVEQFLPYLLRSEAEKRAAFLAIGAIADAEFTSRLAGLFPSDGAVEALGLMATGGPADQRRHAVTALATIATRGGSIARRAASELAELALRPNAEESQYARDALDRTTNSSRKSVVQIQADAGAGPLLGLAVAPGVIVTTVASGLSPGTRVKVSTPSGAQYAVVRKVDTQRGLTLLVLDPQASQGPQAGTQGDLQGLALASEPAQAAEQVMTFTVDRARADAAMAPRTVQVVANGSGTGGNSPRRAGATSDTLRFSAGAAAPEVARGGPLLRMDGTVVGMVARRQGGGDEYEAIGPEALRAFARTVSALPAPPVAPPVTRPVRPAVVPVAAPATPPVKVGGRVEQPVKVKHVEPVYPPLALAAHLAGSVVIEATIDTDGAVQNARVRQSSSPMLDASALRAVQEWRYTPGTLSGVPVPVVVTVTVNFTPR